MRSTNEPNNMCISAESFAISRSTVELLLATHCSATDRSCDTGADSCGDSDVGLSHCTCRLAAAFTRGFLSADFGVILTSSVTIDSDAFRFRPL